MKRIFKCLLISMFLFSCTENENPDPQIPSDGELKITVSPSYLSMYKEVWVILHDLTGKPIESQQVNGEQTITFKVDDSQRYHLTTYRLAESFGNEIELLESFTDISVAEDITLGLSSPFPANPTAAGEFKVNVSNNEIPFGAYLTSKVGKYNYKANQLESQVQMTMSHFTDVQDYLLVAKNSLGESRYKFLSVPTPGSTFNYTFSEMSTYDKVLKFPKSDFSQFYFTSVALTKTNDDFISGYIVNSNNLGGTIGFNPVNSHEMGFLNTIENYEILIEGKRSQNSKTSFGYRRIGTVPNSITLPQDQEIQVQKREVSDFQFSMPSESTEWISTWDQSEPLTGPPIKTLRWIVRGSKSTLKLELPESLKAGKPKLQDLSKFRLESVSVIKHTFSYDQQTRNRIVEIPKKQPLELISSTQFY